jgi:hypothetical protein
MMSRFMNMRLRRQGPPRRLPDVATGTRTDLPTARNVGLDFSYAPPSIMIVGRVRNLSTGSSSSGKSDANSQFYW